MTMKLEPASLGSLRVQMSMSQGRVTIQFHTQTAEAGAMIRDSVESLRTSLESQGLRLENVTIQPLSREASSSSQAGSNHSSTDQQTGQGHQKQDAAGGRSRGYFEQQRQHQRDASGGGGTRSDPARHSHQFDLGNDDFT